MDESLGGEILVRFSPGSLVSEGVARLLSVGSPAHYRPRLGGQLVGEGKVRERAASECCWEESLYLPLNPTTSDEDSKI